MNIYQGFFQTWNMLTGITLGQYNNCTICLYISEPGGWQSCLQMSSGSVTATKTPLVLCIHCLEKSVFYFNFCLFLNAVLVSKILVFDDNSVLYN